MLGLIAKQDEVWLATEFFQLFKTPWEMFDAGHSYEAVLSTGEVPSHCDCKLLVVYSSRPLAWDAEVGLQFHRRLRDRIIVLGGRKLPIYGDIATIGNCQSALGSVIDDGEAPGCELTREGRREVRLGYDLFEEMAFLLRHGQPARNAGYPTLDLHIGVLRGLMVETGLAVIEIPPMPAATQFISCLTHDIDFVSLRQHRFDRATWGFLYRAIPGTLIDYMRGRCSFRKLVRNAGAVLKWPLVQLGLCKDFWLPFRNYLLIEEGKPSTFFLIPFKNRPGKAPVGRDSTRRGVRYDVEDVKEWIAVLEEHGCEVAVHGIDAWHDRALGRQEIDRIASHTGERNAGVRMHWLFLSEQSPQEIEAAGFAYDSTCGYNDAVGYRAGTSQVFRPLGTSNLLELPLHMQDTAMFFPGRMHLTEAEAWQSFIHLLEHSRKNGGVLTVLWHDRSLVPERLWDRFYAAVLNELANGQTWFATARDVVDWFNHRRHVRFSNYRHEGDRVEVQLDNVASAPKRDLSVRLSLAGQRPGEVKQMDVPLGNRSEVSFTLPASHRGLEVSAAAI